MRFGPQLTAACAAVALFAGCQTIPGKPFKAEQPFHGHSLLYLYRPLHISGATVPMLIELNGKTQGRLQRGQYRSFHLKPGKHRLRVRLGRAGAAYGDVRNRTSFTLKPGGVLILRFPTQRLAGWIIDDGNLSELRLMKQVRRPGGGPKAGQRRAKQDGRKRKGAPQKGPGARPATDPAKAQPAPSGSPRP